MGSTNEAQRLIAVSLGKIAMSRQQRGGINLHKNLLVATVLHKARTTYMMDNFQTLLANKRAQAEREAAAKMIVEPEKSDEKTMDTSESRGVIDCNKATEIGVPHGGHSEQKVNETVDKENIVPVSENKLGYQEHKTCDRLEESEKKSSHRDVPETTPIVTGKQPLSSHNGSTNYVSQLPNCRCVGGKRRRSFVVCDLGSEAKKPRFEDEYDISDSDSECENDSGENFERMQTESTQVKSLVDIFSTGFNGLCKEGESKHPTGQINVYVSAERPISGHQYVLKDISCGTQIKDNVALPTAIALAV